MPAKAAKAETASERPAGWGQWQKAGRCSTQNESHSPSGQGGASAACRLLLDRVGPISHSNAIGGGECFFSLAGKT